MTLQILICDDSAFARKQVAGALPQDWKTQTQFACNGIEALAHLRQVGADLLFLDLNMPGLDGYEVLNAIQTEDLPTMTVVISADIQEQAQQKVIALGAIGFINKPVDSTELASLLSEYGLYQALEAKTLTESNNGTNDPISLSEYLQEMANIAMGQASNLLAQLLEVFIHQPIPKVALIERCDLHMAISAIDGNAHYSTVAQGFVGAGVSGEALLLFSDSSSEEMAKLLNYNDSNSLAPEIEVLLDMANILFGAFIKGLGEQLDIKFGLSQPSILGQHKQVEDLLKQHKQQAEQLMCIEIPYELEQQHISCHLLVLLTADSVKRLEQQLIYLTE
ncbi:MAG: response regulator [Oceanisphaera sp.]|uniref:response regulator n=1 Tax=Oceanisphaera sp. TaxID=1929979 RepID=UPI003F9BFFF6